MLDPLRSLAELVRTLTRSRADSRTPTSATQQRRGAEDAATNREPTPNAIGAAEALRERLRQRLRVVSQDRRRAREAFVETVLASELGDAVTLDPAMSEIVAKVAQQLGSDPATDRDLGILIDELTRESR